MILNIAFKELTELIRDSWVRRLVMAFGVLLLIALLASAWSHYRLRSAREEARQTARRIWIEQGNKSPLAASYFGMLAFPPSPALEILDPGVTPYVGQVTRLSAGAVTHFGYPVVLDQLTRSIVPTLSPAVCLQLLFPLLMILVLHSLVSRERESGLERFLHALGVNPATLFFGKILGGAMAVLGLFLASALLILITVAIVGPLAATDLPALILCFALYLLYYGVVLWLIFAISALVRSSQASVTTLLAIWIVVAVLLPAGLADYARTSRRAPSAVEISRILKSDYELGLPGEYPAREVRSDSTLQLLLNQLGAGRREDLPVSWPATNLMTEEELAGASIDHRFKGAREVQAAQSTALRELSSLTPTIAIRTLSQVLCGTDPVQRWASWSELEIARRRFVRILNREMAANAKPTTGELERGRALWDTVGAVDLDPPSPLDALEDQSRQIVTLLLWFAGLSLVAFATVLVLPQRRARQ